MQKERENGGTRIKKTKKKLIVYEKRKNERSTDIEEHELKEEKNGKQKSRMKLYETESRQSMEQRKNPQRLYHLLHRSSTKIREKVKFDFITPGKKRLS